MSSSSSGGTAQYRTGMLVNMDGETLAQSSLTASESSVATGIGVVGRWNLSARTTNTTVYGLHGYSSISAPGSANCTSIGAQAFSVFTGAAFTGTTISNMANGVGVYAIVQAAASIGSNVFQTFYAYDALLSCSATTVQTINNAGYLVARPATFTGAAHIIGSFYGVYLPTATLSGGATITNRYGVYQQDPAAINVFASATRVGATTAPATNTLDVSTAGWGVKLPTAPANGDASALDAYHEGTRVLSAGDLSGWTYVTATQYWTLVGRTVTLHTVFTGGTSSATGGATIATPPLLTPLRIAAGSAVNSAGTALGNGVCVAGSTSSTTGTVTTSNAVSSSSVDKVITVTYETAGL